MSKLYITNDYFNLDRIKWYSSEVKTYFKEGRGVVVPNLRHSLEYTDVNGRNKFITFNGSEVRKFDDIDDAIDRLEERWMGEITNRAEIVKQWEKYKGRKNEADNNVS